MIPLVEVPRFVREYAEGYRALFSPELYEHFQRYLAGLLISENKTIQAINGLFVVQVKDQSSLNRFLTEYHWSATALNERRLELLCSREATRPKRQGVLILDDTHNEKYGKHFPLLGEWFIPSANRYGRSHNVVTLHYADNQVDYPLELAWYEQMDVDKARAWLEEHQIPYKAGKLAKKKPSRQRKYLGDILRRVAREHPDWDVPYPSKLQLACRLIDWAVAHGFRHPVVMDSWYTCREVCQHIAARGLLYVGTVQPDDGLYRGGSWQSLQTWYEHLPAAAFQPVKFRYRGQWEQYWAAAQTAQVDQLGRVRLVVSHRTEDRSDEPRFYVSNYLQWEESYLLKLRRMRWPIESSYEDTKGPLGFAAYELRDEEGIRRHWYLVFAAYSAARQATAEGHWGHWLKRRLQTVGEVSRQVQGEALAALVTFCLMALHQGRSTQALMEQLVSFLRH